MNGLEERLADVRRRLETAAGDRWPVPKLIAVTKTHPAEMILPLEKLGIADIGENRVQEITAKLPQLEGHFQIHLIGRLQTNKVKYIIDHVCMIQSVDRMELARTIDREAQKHERRMPVLVQVSPAGEPQKGGIAPEDLTGFLRELAGLPGLDVRGLMAVMPDWKDEALLRPLFRAMRRLYEQARNEAISGIRMEELSMGMSGDYELAAAEGATMVRVGSAIFGPRDYGPVQTEESK